MSCDTEYMEVLLKLLSMPSAPDLRQVAKTVHRPKYIPETSLWSVSCNNAGWYDAGLSDVARIQTRAFSQQGCALTVRDTCQHGAALIKVAKVAKQTIDAYWVPRLDRPCVLGAARCFYLTASGELVFHKINSERIQAEVWERFVKGAGIVVNFSVSSIPAQFVKLLTKIFGK